MISLPWSQKSISGVTVRMPREELIRRGRILIVDDERPEIIEDLQKIGFSVDYESDLTVANLHMVEGGTYDLILLDFGNVGRELGTDEGLSLLQHIKRTTPSVVVFAYTSKALRSTHADFYRLADGVLAKDASITTTAEKIEDGLRAARNLENLWRGFLAASHVEPGSDKDRKMQDLLVRGLADPKKLKRLAAFATALFGGGAEKLGAVLMEKIMELVHFAS